MSHPTCVLRPSQSATDDQLVRRLHNVFRVLAIPDHKLRREAIKLRQTVSSAWRDQAARGQWFPWPTTTAPRGTGRLDAIGWREHGMLAYLGYHVGQTQPTPPGIRRGILEYVFECHLPPLNDRSYYIEWGAPLTPERLKKTADTLASLTRNAKRRDEFSLAAAIDDWEEDLLYLHERYYVHFFNFGWPGTELWE
jgi:hypothetical protein